MKKASIFLLLIKNPRKSHLLGGWDTNDKKKENLKEIAFS